MARILLTGGTGFIGSHTAVALAEAGHVPVLLDNFANSEPSVVEAVGAITGASPTLVEADIRDRDTLAAVLRDHKIDAVVHFAGLKAVAQSVADPVAYWDVNVGGMIALLGAMRETGCRRLIFSSSATVYGEPAALPVDETAPTGAINPYGATKLACEQLMENLAASEAGWDLVALRYFNPVGAHPSGSIGEAPRGSPNNLMPILLETVTGRRGPLSIFGDDYDTPDGTAVRDYIHVMDLAEGHVAALEAPGEGFRAFNLGTGRGTSVLELVRAFEQATGVPVPREKAPRRPGDVPVLEAAVGKAERELGWRATRSIAEMCRDAWRFASRN
ncbi:UDP-glucose 4-epimerase GalE [Sphingomicrobium nitratireducens]|uniref:UDP-glucose 4-epimerase GalE n=1 Tax=Sphingomicrobium nitratireducens TaxID=2964666 RepID=UPI0022404510|nr:UDP-glucose 4-epimerase GalE [Sphingomicrobium nitratireducens]